MKMLHLGLRLTRLAMASGGPKAPNQVSGLYAWWDVSVASSLLRDRTGVDPTLASSDGDPIGTILDQSGNNRRLQAVAGDATRPTLKVGIQAGKNGARFDAVDDVLRCDTVGSSLMSGNDKPFTVIWVGKQASNVGNRTFWGTNNSANSMSNHRFRCNGTTSYHSDRRDDAGSNTSVSGSTPNTSTHVFALRFTGTATSFFRDSVAIYENSAQNVGTITLTSFSVGAWYRNASGEVTEEYLNGDFFEMAVYDSALSASDCVSVSDYLKTKWGV